MTRSHLNTDVDEIITCTACGEECSTTVVDMGIGAYEYWGATGFDSQPTRVSSCCEAAFTSTEREN